MNIVIISASMRANSQSLKVSNWLKVRARSLGADVTLVDLHEKRLPLFDVGETSSDHIESVLAQLELADGFVFVSPEWNGMLSHGLVNLLQYVGEQMAHKPTMLCGVSAGRGGMYPLLQMRQIGYKNNHFVVSPESLLVQDVNNMLNDNSMDSDAPDLSVKKRAEYALTILLAYAEALKTVRESSVIDSEAFPNGV